MPRSLDGITRRPAKRDIYVAKRRLDAQRTEPVVSLQKHRSRQKIDELLSDIDIESAQAPEHELVINISRHFSIRASISIVIQYIIFAGIAIAAAYSTNIGQWFVAIFAIYAILTRQDSRLTYGIALFIFISVPFFQIINQPGVANNITVYAFELVLLGTVQTYIEIKSDQKSKNSP